MVHKTFIIFIPVFLLCSGQYAYSKFKYGKPLIHTAGKGSIFTLSLQPSKTIDRIVIQEMALSVTKSKAVPRIKNFTVFAVRE
jgi:hypothetical protein